MGAKLRTTAAMAALLAGAIGARAADPEGEVAARAILADRWLNDARNAARATEVPPELARRQVLLLLGAAKALQPDSLEILEATADAAKEARDRDLLKDVLKQIVRLDPHDLVAQVDLVTVMAEGTQAIEDQLRVYTTAVNQDQLDAQVRSELALKLARLYLQRSDIPSATKFVDRATDLNEANAGAWELKIALQATGPTKVSDRMAAIVKCLLANPFQPAAWFAGGRALAATNQHDLAADYLAVGIDGAQRSGAGVQTDVLLDWALESAIADRRPDAEPLLRKIAVIEDTPVAGLVTALSVIGPSVTATAPAGDPLVKRISEKLAAAVKAAPDDKTTVADAAWIEIFYMPTVSPRAGAYLDQYKGLAGDKDPTYLRMRGWQSLREGKLGEATLLLAPLAAADPLAQLGLARIAAASGDTKNLTAQLQDIWNSHPSGLLALQVANEARKNKVALKDTSLGQSVRAAALSLPQSVFTSGSQPRDVMLVLPTVAKPKYSFGDPITMSVKIINTTDHTLSAGPGGAIKSSLALAAAMRGTTSQSIGPYAMDNQPNVYRLPPRGSLIRTVRVDQGAVYELLQASAARNMTVGLTLMTDPRPAPSGLVPGLGGQLVPVGEFLREGAAVGKLEDVQRMAAELPTRPANRQMLTGLMLMQLLPELSDPKSGDVGKATRDTITQSLVKIIGGPSNVANAWFIRVAPLAGLPEEIETALARAGQSADASARIAWYGRVLAQSRLVKEGADALRERLKDASEKDADPVAKEWASILYREAILPPPATAPASAPAASAPAK